MTTVVKVNLGGKTWPAVAGRAPQPVLGPIDLAVQAGSFVILTGPSGCGKSTLLNIIAGLDRDYAGRVVFDPPEQAVTYIFQSPRLLPWRTVFENVALALPDGDPRVASIPDLLTRVGLDGAADVYPERLSLGMQRRVALARGFVGEPDLLLMDEPFVSLDDPTARDLRALLIDLWSRRPTTVLFVTHDRTEAVTLGTRILRMGGTPATVLEDAQVGLAPSDRADRNLVRNEQQRIFGAT
ncbi:MAG: ABC transporter ATP-binding protein [Hyphomicrobiaceae bacterium]|nr:ABC transporter ATP-binding protein [Hyphomicrobiaceae bacterium]